MDLKKFKTDLNAEQDGVWVELGDGRIRIARLNNPRMVAAFAARTRKYRGGLIPPEEEERITRECMAEHVVIDWENFTKDDQPFPYSKENADEALKLKDFAEFVLERSRSMELFRAEDVKSGVEAIAKN